MIKKQERQGQVKTRQDGINLSPLRLVLNSDIIISKSVKIIAKNVEF